MSELEWKLAEKTSSPSAGFIGDKVGYRVILILNTLVCALCATGLTLIPEYKEYEQIPHAVLFKNSSAAESSDVPYSIVSVQWSICQVTIESGKIMCTMEGDRDEYLDQSLFKETVRRQWMAP